MSICETGKHLYRESKRIINDAMDNQQLVLFVGAGTSVDSGMPLWEEAISKIAEKMALTDNQNDTLKIPQYYYNDRGKKEYTQLMRDIFRYDDNLFPTKLHKKILEFQTSTIVTTNYDHLIEQAAEDNGEFIRVISQDIDMPYRKSRRELIKMHGDFEHDNFVLKEDDYLNYSRNFKLIETYVKSLIGSKVVLFIGYSLNDPDVKHIISWVKDILKEDFQRAYLILTKAEPNSIEKEYFRNLGINLIYGSELVNQKEITHSGQLIEVLDYLLIKEQDNNLDTLYDELKPLEELNYVYGKYIVNAFRKNGIVCGDDNSIGLIDNGDDLKNKPLIEAVWGVLENGSCDKAFDKEKIQSVIRVCEKSRFSKVIKNQGSKYVTKQLNSIDKNSIEKMIFEFDYEGLHKFLEKNNAKLSPENPDLYMQQAFVCAFLYDYYSAYNYLKLAAQAFYARKSYAWYFIAEFNRKYVGKIVLAPFNIYDITADEIEIIEGEVKAIDLDRVLNSIPDIGNNSNMFLHELKSFTISYTLFYNVYADSLKTNEQASNTYSLFAGTAAYESLRVKIKDFDRYETSNYIILDRFTENKSIFDLYIRTILSSINVSDITIEDDEGACGNIKPDSLTDFDLYVILRYMQQKEMKKFIKEYGIKNLPLSQEGVTYLHTVCKSICNESKHKKKTIYEIDRFWIYLELLGHIKITVEIAQSIFERLNMINDKIDIRSYRDTINSFIRNVCDEKLFENQEICKLAKSFSEKIVQFVIEDDGITGSITSLLNNLAYFISKGSVLFDNIELIKSLVGNDQKSILFEIYPYLVEQAKVIINEKYMAWYPKDGNAEEYYQYCNALLTGVKEPNKEIEQVILRWISVMVNKEVDEKRHIVMLNNNIDFMDVLKQLINLYLNNKIIDIELLKSTTEKTNDEMSKWLLNLDKFDYKKFNCSWLLLCHQGLIKSIAENENARKNILRVYKEQYETLANREKINDIIVKHFI